MGYQHPDEDRPDDRQDRDGGDREQEREERGGRVDQPRDDPELDRDQHAHNEDPQKGRSRKPHGSVPRGGMPQRKSSGGYRRITVFRLSFSSIDPLTADDDSLNVNRIRSYWYAWSAQLA